MIDGQLWAVHHTFIDTFVIHFLFLFSVICIWPIIRDPSCPLSSQQLGFLSDEVQHFKQLWRAPEEVATVWRAMHYGRVEPT